MGYLNQVSGLKLHQYQSCPNCAVTRQTINQTGLYIEERDVQLHPEYLQELISGGGKFQVPALRIECSHSETQWLYEPKDIINFLHVYVSYLTIAA